MDPVANGIIIGLLTVVVFFIYAVSKAEFREKIKALFREQREQLEQLKKNQDQDKDEE
jgi:hypothetical protein